MFNLPRFFFVVFNSLLPWASLSFITDCPLRRGGGDENSDFWSSLQVTLCSALTCCHDDFKPHNSFDDAPDQHLHIFFHPQGSPESPSCGQPTNSCFSHHKAFSFGVSHFQEFLTGRLPFLKFCSETTNFSL